MPLRLDSQSADFSTRFRPFLGVKREAAQDVEKSVRHILAEVKAHGDRALLQLTLEFDRLDLSKVSMRVSADEIEAAAKSCEPQALAALKLARERIEAYHLRQKPKDECFTDALGVEMGSRWTAIEAVGLYVPGRTGSQAAIDPDHRRGRFGRAGREDTGVAAQDLAARQYCGRVMARFRCHHPGSEARRRDRAG